VKLTKEQIEEMRAVAMPLMRWMADNCHPHCTVILDSTSAEIVEGLAMVKNPEPIS